MGEKYWTGYYVTWVIIFVSCWIYAIFTYGFLLGVGLGWLPSAIVASLASLIWPLIIVLLVIVIVTVLKGGT